jgi:hypothetical protein
MSEHQSCLRYTTLYLCTDIYGVYYDVFSTFKLHRAHTTSTQLLLRFKALESVLMRVQQRGVFDRVAFCTFALRKCAFTSTLSYTAFYAVLCASLQVRLTDFAFASALGSPDEDTIRRAAKAIGSVSRHPPSPVFVSSLLIKEDLQVRSAPTKNSLCKDQYMRSITPTKHSSYKE